MLFMLLTLARREDVADARWRDFDFAQALWTIRDPKNTDGRPREPDVVPLSRQALALIGSRMPAPLDPEGRIFGTAGGGPLSNWDRETKRIIKLSGVSGWHRHDLRRTGATMLGEMGELPDIVEAALNHSAIRSPLAATYNRARYRPQVAFALQRLADALDHIANTGPPNST
jgi:integrase